MPPLTQVCSPPSVATGLVTVPVERWLWGRRATCQVLGPVVLGLLLLVVLVGTAGRAARVPGQTLPWRWWGVLGGVGSPVTSAWAGAVEVLAVAGLLLCWSVLLQVGQRVRLRVMAGAAVLWTAPVALGPPGFSLDVYSYLAQGRLAAVGLDPYAQGPAALGGGPWLSAVDPFWRGAVSPYGPLAVLLEHGAAATGSPVAGLLLLHAVAWLSVLATAGCVVAMAPARYRAVSLLLTAMNPLVLLQLLGAAHWEALLVALMVGALWTWRNGRAATGLCLASAAAAIKLPAGYLVLVLVVLHLSATPPARRARAAVVAAAAVGAPWLLGAVLVPDPLGWLAALGTPLTGRTLYAPTTLLAESVAKLSSLAGHPVGFDGLLSICRAAGLLAAAATCAALLVTATRRSAAATVGTGLLILALLGPVLYPWYLTWGLIPLGTIYPQHRRGAVGLTMAGSMLALPGCSALGKALLSVPAPVIALAVLGVASAAAAVAWLSARPGTGPRTRPRTRPGTRPGASSAATPGRNIEEQTGLNTCGGTTR